MNGTRGIFINFDTNEKKVVEIIISADNVKDVNGVNHNDKVAII